MAVPLMQQIRIGAYVLQQRLMVSIVVGDVGAQAATTRWMIRMTILNPIPVPSNSSTRWRRWNAPKSLSA